MKAGEHVGEHYRLIRLIGKGGMGEVWMSEDLRLGRKVAIKFFTSNFGDRDKAAQRFLREARVTARLRNPHVVTVHEFAFPDTGLPYLVMEYVSGEALFDRMARDKRLQPAVAVHVCRQIAVALGDAHEAGIIHRDLKPENVLLSSLAGDPWYVKVVDFGLARSYDEEQDSTSDIRRLTTAAVILGTPAYMSPEQALGRPMDPRSDLYALGVMLYQMLSAKLPISGKTPQEYLVSHQIQRPQPLVELPGCDRLPEALLLLVMALLEKRPDARPGSAAVVATELGKIAAALGREGSGPGAAAAPAEGEPPPRSRETLVSQVPDSDPAALGALQTALTTRAFIASDSPLAKARLVTKSFYGREEETAWLLQQFQATVDRAQPRFVAVHGPPGAGVSRLILQILPRVHQAAPEARLLRVFPWGGIADLPGRPFSDLFVRAVGLKRKDSPTAVRARFRDAFRKLGSAGVFGGLQDADQVARRAGEVLGLLVGAMPSSEEQRTPEVVYQEIVELGARFLSGVFGEVPTVLVVDNAEKLRPAARALLVGWLERMHPARWLVVLGVHGEDLSALGSPLVEKASANTMALRPLPKKALVELTRAYEKGLEQRSGYLRSAMKRSEGLPGRLHHVALAQLLGEGVESYARTSTTPEAEILRVAAGCGNTFPLDVVEHIVGAPVVDTLNIWARQGLLSRTEVHELGGARGYSFISGAMFRHFRKGLRRSRATVHERALEWYRDQTSKDLVLLSYRLLGHQIGRANLAGALHQAERLGEHASAMGALGEAAEVAGRVVSALQSRASRKQLTAEEYGMYERAALRLAHVRTLVGNRDQARALLEDAEQLGGRFEGAGYQICRARVLRGLADLAVDPEERNDILLRAIATLEDRKGGEGSEGGKRGEDGEAELDASGLRTAAELRLALAETAARAGRTAEADRQLDRGLDLARRSGSHDLLLSAATARADLAVALGRLEEAEALLQDARNRAREGSARSTEAEASLRLGLLLGRSGKMDESIELIREAGRLHAAERSPRGVIEAGLAEAMIALIRPDYWAARRTLEQLVVDPVGQPALAGRRLALLARVSMHTGEPEQALIQARKAMSFAQEAGDERTALRAQLIVLDSLMHAGDQNLQQVSRGLAQLVRRQRGLGDVEGLARTYAFTALEAVRGKLPAVSRKRSAEILDQAVLLFRQIGHLAEVKRLEDLRRRHGV